MVITARVQSILRQAAFSCHSCWTAASCGSHPAIIVETNNIELVPVCDSSAPVLRDRLCAATLRAPPESRQQRQVGGRQVECPMPDRSAREKTLIRGPRFRAEMSRGASQRYGIMAFEIQARGEVSFNFGKPPSPDNGASSNTEQRFRYSLPKYLTNSRSIAENLRLDDRAV